jgi:hypothetical protein
MNKSKTWINFLFKLKILRKWKTYFKMRCLESQIIQAMNTFLSADDNGLNCNFSHFKYSHPMSSQIIKWWQFKAKVTSIPFICMMNCLLLLQTIVFALFLLHFERIKYCVRNFTSFKMSMKRNNFFEIYVFVHKQLFRSHSIYVLIFSLYENFSS